jgi:hypothetical protein
VPLDSHGTVYSLVAQPGYTRWILSASRDSLSVTGFFRCSLLSDTLDGFCQYLPLSLDSLIADISQMYVLVAAPARFSRFSDTLSRVFLITNPS